MSISLPPRPSELDDTPPLDQEALIEEARRRARRRQLRTLAGLLAAVLGALWIYSLLGGSGPQSGSAFPESSSRSATPPRAALPEELSYNANGGVVLVRRDGSRRVLAKATYRHLPSGRWVVRQYNGIEWSQDGSKLLALRWGSTPRALVVIDAKGTVGPAIAQALDGRWSPDGTRIAFVRHEPGLGRVLYLAAGDGRSPVRLATHLGAFSWSPDGTNLAYTRADAPGLLIAATSGRAAPRQVAIAAGVGARRPIGGEVQWSPDGSLIAFATGSGAFVVRPDGTSLVRVMTGGSQIVWSPDSKLLATVVGFDVYVVRADGGGLRRTGHCPCTFRGATGTSVAWSSDGSRIAYVSGRGNDVSTVRPDGSGAAVVAPRAVAGPSGLAVSWPLWRPPS